jgi:hypothetical protein
VGGRGEKEGVKGRGKWEEKVVEGEKEGAREREKEGRGGGGRWGKGGREKGERGRYVPQKDFVVISCVAVCSSGVGAASECGKGSSFVQIHHHLQLSQLLEGAAERWSPAQ